MTEILKLKLSRKVKKETLNLVFGQDGYCIRFNAIQSKHTRKAAAILNKQKVPFCIGKYEFHLIKS